MQTLMPFDYAGTSVRTLVVEEGSPLFCGRDVASVLGYKDPVNALKLHCKGVAIYHPLETPGGIQQMRFITEGDLYRLIFNSKLPEAEAFEDWVVSEVLPAIRKRGMYATDELLKNPCLLRDVLNDYVLSQVSAIFMANRP